MKLVVDTPALFAIMNGEPEAQRFHDILLEHEPVLSGGTMIESYCRASAARFRGIPVLSAIVCIARQTPSGHCRRVPLGSVPVATWWRHSAAGPGTEGHAEHHQALRGWGRPRTALRRQAPRLRPLSPCQREPVLLPRVPTGAWPSGGSQAAGMVRRGRRIAPARGPSSISLASGGAPTRSPSGRWRSASPTGRGSLRE